MNENWNSSFLPRVCAHTRAALVLAAAPRSVLSCLKVRQLRLQEVEPLALVSLSSHCVCVCKTQLTLCLCV